MTRTYHFIILLITFLCGFLLNVDSQGVYPSRVTDDVADGSVSASGDIAAQPGDADSRLRAYIRNIERYNILFPQEKVYLHFDNTGYFRGETMWFKAYVVRADNNCSTDLSRVLYVELLNPTGDVIETRKLKIENGQAAGSIDLKDLLGSGFYEVRAYTRYMLNWDAAGIFSRVLPIFNAPKTAGDYSRKVIDEISHRKRLPDNREQPTGGNARLNVRFYPEGGRLVRGLASRVAFDVTDASGTAVAAAGELTFPDGTVSAVSTLREGRGVFSYTPADTPATLVLGDSTGRRHSFTLPAADASGCVMTVAATGDDDCITVNVVRTDDEADSLGLVLISGGSVCAFDIITADERPAVRSFRRADMEDGVSQIALISPSGAIVSERMVFVRPAVPADTVAISLGDAGIVPGGMGGIRLETRPGMTLSVAVRDYATEVSGRQEDAATWLLLSSDLKGYISNPGYYLESDDAEHRRAADLLMMVQGWRRYDVSRMMRRTEKAGRHYIEDGLYITGRVSPAQKKAPATGVPLSVTLYNRRGMSFSGTARTDSTGSYAFRLPDCEGDLVMLMDTRTADSKAMKYKIGIDRNFSPASRVVSPAETSVQPVGEPLFAPSPAEDDAADTGFREKSGSITSRTHHLKNVRVRGHRLLERAREGWESESAGAYRAVLRYDCDRAADELADEGKDMPEIFEWLATKNEFLDCSMHGSLDDQAGWVYRGRADTVLFAEEETSIGWLTVEGNHKKALMPDAGLSYKNRPIVVVLNNCFYTVANCPRHFKLEDIEGIHRSTNEVMPVNLDEFKAVYISEDDNIWKHYISCQKLEGYSPVTVFLYGHHTYPVKHKGMRRTHFEGYSAAETFEMPGHSPLPPSDDHRRTIYWNPNVTTDSHGRASINFYNSPDCRSIAVSAESITAGGRAVVGQ